MHLQGLFSGWAGRQDATGAAVGCTAGSLAPARRSSGSRAVLAASLAIGLPAGCLYPAMAANPWSTVGPYGGDARRLTAEPGNPRHLYLGTTSSWIYKSEDGGSSWQRLAKLGKGDDLAVDNIVVDASDAKTIVVGVWQVDERGGGIYVSHDGGEHWTSSPSMAGQSVRALAESPSNPKIYVAGSVEGVFRSEDGGQSWTKITPEGSRELHEVESVAIDPVDPGIIYAGTWHLPWKTTDGGQSWANVKQGLIDDSDVFSIIIDPAAPSIVYASACSGIYKSLNGGALFRKVQGIPSTARRTRVLMQDPEARNIVYAGTTEGLYKTSDSGADWSRLTGPDVIINDVFVDPKNDQHLLLATDRSGVLESEDGGKTFQGSNTGFSQRQVQSVLLDHNAPSTIYAGVLNDKIYGGVFISQDGGDRWQQHSEGLEGRDVYTLAQADDGTVLAGTGHGIFRWDGSSWQRDGQLVVWTEKQVKVRSRRAGGRSVEKQRAASVMPAVERPPTPPEPAAPVPAPPATGWTPVYKPAGKGPGKVRARSRVTNVASSGHRSRTGSGARTQARAGAYQTVKHETVTAEGQIDSRVNELSVTGATWFAATSTGLYRSGDQGKSWEGPVNALGATGPALETDFVDAEGTTVIAAGPSGLMLSDDSGQGWHEVSKPGGLTRIRALVAAANRSLWVGGREGLFYSEDEGGTWKPIAHLPLGEISGLTYDADLKRVLVTSQSSTIIFGVDGTDSQWKWWDAGWKVHEVHSKNGRLVGASFFDGIVIEPEPSAGTTATATGAR